MQRAAKYLTLIFLTAVVMFAAGCPSKGESAQDVAASVNGKNIMMSEVDTVLTQKAGGQQAQMSNLELAAARMQVLDDLVKQEILFQRAEKEKLLPTEDEVTIAIDAQKHQNGMTEEQYQKYLKDNGQTEQGVREIARKQLAIQKLMDKMSGQIKISDKEVQDFYDNNPKQFIAARGVGLAAIVVDPADNGMQDDAKGDTEAKQKIDVIYARLTTNHADFASLAREKSEDSNSNLRGGDIGFATEDQLKQNGFPPEIIAQFFGPMQIGDISQPVHFATGQWYIFKLTDKRLQAENLTMDSPDVRKQITDGLLSQRKQVLSTALLEVATNDAKIVNNLAQKMLDSPQNFGTMRPIPPPSSSPTAGASPQASTNAAPAASPKTTAAAKTSPTPKK